jgi:sec-independent protein translocase protein TatA
MFRNPLTDSIVVLVVLLLIFGPKRLPGLGRSLGQGIKEFKDSIGGGSSESDDQPAMIPAQTSAASPASAVTQAQATTSEQ